MNILGHILLGHILLGHILLGHILLGHILLGLLEGFVGGILGALALRRWTSRKSKRQQEMEIRHSMDEQEFRALVAGKKVTLQIDKRISQNSVVVALQDIGYERMFQAVIEGTQRRQEPPA